MGDDEKPAKAQLGIGLWITIISTVCLVIGQAGLLLIGGITFYINTNNDLGFLKSTFKETMPAIGKELEELRTNSQISKVTESNLEQRMKAAEDELRRRKR